MTPPGAPGDLPPWVALDHAGLVARWGPTTITRAGCAGIGCLAALWTVIIPVGAYSSGLDAGLICMSALLLVLWPIAIGMAIEVTDRHELRLAADGLSWIRWRYGIPRRIAVPLAETRISSRVIEGSKGSTHIFLHLAPPTGREHRIALPAGQSLRDRDQTKRHLAWLEATLREAAALAPPADQPDPEARAALAALLQRRIGEGP